MRSLEYGGSEREPLADPGATHHKGGSMKTKIIKIDRYESVLENNEIVWYAVKGTGDKEQRFRMPAAFQKMYNDKHLAISPREDCPMPELYGEHGTFYVPRRTA